MGFCVGPLIRMNRKTGNRIYQEKVSTQRLDRVVRYFVIVDLEYWEKKELLR